MSLVPIGELVSKIAKWNPVKDAPDEEISYIDIASVSQTEKAIDGVSNILGSEAPSRARQLVEQGDVLVSTVRPNLNAVAWVSEHFDKATASTGFCVLRPNPRKLSDRYLFHWVRSPSFIANMSRLATGQSYPAVSDKIICGSAIPLPPLAEQKRIAGILDQADALRRLRHRAVERLNTLGQAIFHEMFGDPATNPKCYEQGSIRDLLLEAKYGTSKKSNTDRVGLPMLRMGNITYDGQVDFTNLKHVELDGVELEKYCTQAGDILFNRTNSKELVGKTAIIETDDPMAIAGYLVRARVNEKASPYYLNAYMNSPHAKKTLRNMCKNIVGMANINAQEFQNIPIAIPPITEQSVFEERLKLVANEKPKLEQAVQQSETLFASLQQRAFRGEL